MPPKLTKLLDPFATLFALPWLSLLESSHVESDLTKWLTTNPESVEYSQLCLELLSLPVEAPSWSKKLAIFECCLHAKETFGGELKLKAISLLPRFVHGLCSSNRNESEIMRDVHNLLVVLSRYLGYNCNFADNATSVFSEQETLTAQQIARHIGLLCCSVSRNTRMSYDQESRFGTIKCIICDGMDIKISTNSSSNIQRFLPFRDIEPLLTSLHRNEDTNVKCSFLFGLPRILMHSDITGEYKNNVLTQTLPMVAHANNDIRLAMAHALQAVSRDSGKTFFGDEHEKLMNLFQLLKLQLANNYTNTTIQETLLTTFGCIARVVDGEYLICLLMDLIYTASNPNINPDLRAVAHEQLLSIAQAKEKSIKELIFCAAFQKEMYMYIIDQVLVIPNLLDELCGTLLDHLDTNKFLQTAMPIILPNILIEYDRAKKQNALEYISKRLSVAMGSLILDNLSQVLCYVLIEAQEKLKSVMAFIVEITNSEVHDLFTNFLSDILNGLVCHLGREGTKEKVLTALSIVIDLAFPKRDKKPTTTDFIRDNFLSIIDFMNGVFSANSQIFNTYETKVNNNFHQHQTVISFMNQYQVKDSRIKEIVLKGLEELIVLLGSHVNTMRPKLIATLELVLKEPDLQLLACSAWLTFIKKLDVNNIGPILSQIFVDLLPLVKAPQTERLVVEIFRYLVVENRDALRTHFKEIPFINMYEYFSLGMREIVEILQSETGMTLQDELDQLIRGISHENLNVRLSGLQKLKNVLREKRPDIRFLTAAKDNVDPVIAKLVTCLLVGCREPEKNARLLFAECIGELGAIDPGRVDIVLKPELPTEKSELDIAVELIQEYLIKAFRASRDTKSQDRASFAIQELLAFCGCNDKEGKSATSKGGKSPRRGAQPTQSDGNAQKKGQEIWNKFPEEIRDILRPYLTSSYHLKQRPYKEPNTPFFSQPDIKSFRLWITSWVSHLIAKSQDKYGIVFSACR